MFQLCFITRIYMAFVFMSLQSQKNKIQRMSQVILDQKFKSAIYIHIPFKTEYDYVFTYVCLFSEQTFEKKVY